VFDGGHQVTTPTKKATSLTAFTVSDCETPKRLAARLNDMVSVLQQAQQVRTVYVKVPNIRISATDNTWSCQLRPTGFNVGGVALVAFRPSNSNQRTPRYGQSIDFVQLADGSVQINGVSGSTPTLGIFFQAAFVLWEDA